MKKKLIPIIAVAIVAVIAIVAIVLLTVKESKQLTSENLTTYYDVSIEITDYVRGERETEILGLIATYKPSTAKVHITVTPKDKLVCDGAKINYALNDDFWKVIDGSNIITIDLNEEGSTEVFVDIEADLKISTIAEPELSTIELSDAVGTVTYKKFINKF